MAIVHIINKSIVCAAAVGMCESIAFVTMYRKKDDKKHYKDDIMGEERKGRWQRMIHAEIAIGEIQYEKSFRNLFPSVIETCKKMNTSNLAIRFLLKMEDASMTAVAGILNRMDEKCKGQLLCGFANLYCQEIQEALNTLLQQDELGRNISIGEIYMGKDSGGQLFLSGRNIKADYSAIMKNNTVKQKIGEYANQAVKKSVFGGIGLLQKVASEGAGIVAEIAAEAAPDVMEKTLISIMNNEENKYRLLQMAEQVLEERGICVRLKNFVFVQEENFDLQEDTAGKIVEERGSSERKIVLSPELEEGLLDAVAGYLKSLVKE